METEALRKIVESRRPFRIRLTDGSLVSVPHPEFILITQDGKTAVVNTTGSEIKFVNVELVTAVETGEPSPKQP